MPSTPSNSTTPVTELTTAVPVSNNTTIQEPSEQVQEISTLIGALTEVARDSDAFNATPRINKVQSQIVQSRLAVASGLFTALRAKHAPTATHCLRVALGCSAWAKNLGVSEEERTLLEIAALLHDVGKIGVPEFILTKPSHLKAEELAIIQRQSQLGVEILRDSQAPKELLDIIYWAPAWFNGEHPFLKGSQNEIPIPARMLAIVDAYDSMTTDHLYRPAKSRERALVELFEFSGTQFDPKLVQHFYETFSKNLTDLMSQVSDRWLNNLQEVSDQLPWTPTEVTKNDSDKTNTSNNNIFHKNLIDNMRDAIICVDAQGHIFEWNEGAHRLTGIASSAAIGKAWTPELLEMNYESGRRIPMNECPVRKVLTTETQGVNRLAITGRNGRISTIEIHTVPVADETGTLVGATILIHDVSDESSLEEKCQQLHDQVALDPMTKIANRAEFDRMLLEYIDAHCKANMPCSLIMCDIDHFKKINDTFGHQAGDEAIITFAQILKSQCRAGDLVARYGGEEFAVICTDCDNATVAHRADQIRKKIAQTTFPCLGNKGFTASFGVTQLQPGDSAESFLRRSDRALLQAKDHGRNQVIQLGDGAEEEDAAPSGWWFFNPWVGKTYVESDLMMTVPIEIAIEKLRGFIADHNAEIVKTTENQIWLVTSDAPIGEQRRSSDRPIDFNLVLTFEKVSSTAGVNSSLPEHERPMITKLHVDVRPKRNRDRRQKGIVERSRLLLRSLKSYLMARDFVEETNS